MKTTVLIASKTGRLGNRLFLSAYFMANAMARGYRLLNPALGEYARFFEGSARDPWCRFPSLRRGMDHDIAEQCREMILRFIPVMSRLVPGRMIDIRATLDAEDGVYDLNGEDFLRRIEAGGLIFAKGWKFRDGENLLSGHRAIADYFTPVAEIRAKAELAVQQARSLGDFVIGVHVRQGDYREWKGGVHYFESVQYARWMHEASRLHPGRRIAFLVCASDPVDAGIFSDFAVTWGPGDVVADLHALSLCDTIIGPPSTFSTWASYRGRVPLCVVRSHTQEIKADGFRLVDRV